MPVRPEIRYFIPCWKEPTISGSGPSAHEILTAIQAKKGHSYPLWQRPFFTLVMITNLHGPCDFSVEMRLEELEEEILIAATDKLSLDPGNDPLRIQPVSIMMKAVKLPRPGV
jgi:hypothetical protein